MVDKLGQEIVVGAIVAYPISVGSHSTQLRIGKVVKIGTGTNWRDEEYPVIFIRGVDDSWSRDPILNARNGRLEDPKKIIVLPAVPEPYSTLLDKVANL